MRRCSSSKTSSEVSAERCTRKIPRSGSSMTMLWTSMFALGLSEYESRFRLYSAEDREVRGEGLNALAGEAEAEAARPDSHQQDEDRHQYADGSAALHLARKAVLEHENRDRPGWRAVQQHGRADVAYGGQEGQQCHGHGRRSQQRQQDAEVGAQPGGAVHPRALLQLGADLQHPSSKEQRGEGAFLD